MILQLKKKNIKHIISQIDAISLIDYSACKKDFHVMDCRYSSYKSKKNFIINVIITTKCGNICLEFNQDYQLINIYGLLFL